MTVFTGPESDRTYDGVIAWAERLDLSLEIIGHKASRSYRAYDSNQELLLECTTRDEVMAFLIGYEAKRDDPAHEEL